jgi:1-acyl-sn-glycerol-3-phosphate acyltransferase
MYYKHNLDYEYPEHCDEHMIDFKRVKSIDFNEDYPYLPRGFWYKTLRVIYWLALNIIVFPLMRLTHGLRIHGKKNLKKHKKELKDGAITISNHVFYWDYLCVLKTIRPRLAYFPAWKDNLEGPNRNLVRMSGGIPVPTGNVHAMIKFNKAIEEVIESGKWLHFFPEGSMWFFFPDIRPLKKAVFQYAVKYNKPIVPITMSFRPRKGIMKLFSKKPRVDLHVGEPLYPDTELPCNEAVHKMQAEAYHVMQVMNGINPGDPNYCTDLDPRNYQKTM